jgi:hypothetical protein
MPGESQKTAKNVKNDDFCENRVKPGFWPKWPNPGSWKKVSVPGRAFFPLWDPAVSKY